MTRRRTWVAGLALVASLAYAGTTDAAEPARIGRVANTDGAALRMRSAPNAEAPIVKRLGSNWRVTVLGGASPDGRWLRVEHGGNVGWVAVGYISFEDGVTQATTGGATSGGQRTGRVTNTDGGTLRLRATPEFGATVLARLAPGAQVTITGEAQGGGQWLPVEHQGRRGFVASDYIDLSGAASTPAPTRPAPSPPASTGRSGWVANTDGATLRVRSQPSIDGEVVKQLSEGWRVSILEGPISGTSGGSWVRVEHGGVVGWVAASYIAGSAAGGADLPAPPPPARVQPTTTTSAAGQAMVRDATRMRDQPGLSGEVIMMLQAGALVERIGRELSVDGYRWVGVRVLGREGWAISPSLGPVPTTAQSRAMVAEALAQTGRPYVWGGETPNPGFDCSGLVRYVVKKVTGIDVTHVLAYQAQAGSPVERDEMQVGDLVFFRNTYKLGLSHVGFYLGDNQFVAANNETVGVSRATLGSTYWGSRFYSARRLAD